VKRISSAVLIGLALWFPLGGVAIAQEDQLSRTMQAAARSEQADNDLNKVYKHLAANLDAKSKKKLLDAELAWIKFRDAECESESDWFRGGSLSKWQYHECFARLTKVRTTELKDALANYHIR
jgi:uncharacterized protein YecT (DUF1311 family)